MNTTQQQIGNGDGDTDTTEMLRRLEQEFPVSGFYITRQHLEDLGFDTANVDDCTMEAIASRLSDRVDGQNEVVWDVTDDFNIPKH